MTRKAEVSGAAPAAFDVRSVWDTGGHPFEMAERACRAWMGGVMQLQDEALDYMRASAGRGVSVANQIARCASAAEAFELQSRYAQESVAGWLDESRRIADMVGAMWQQNVAILDSPVQDATPPDTPPDR